LVAKINAARRNVFRSGDLRNSLQTRTAFVHRLRSELRSANLSVPPANALGVMDTEQQPEQNITRKARKQIWNPIAG